MNHTFVILAYKESLYLEECICSLKNQTVESEIVIATSTPNEYISNLASKYNIEVKVNPRGSQGIGSDFDFAIEAAGTQFCTTAHQDDTYEPEYAEQILKNIDKQTIIAFSDYHEINNGEYVSDSTNFKVKRVLLFPLKFKLLQRCKWIRRRVLSLGNPICCPAVTYNKQKVNTPLFSEDMKSNVDWAAWERLSKEPGSFVYVAKDLMMHRVHAESTTTETIVENKRTGEDYTIFCRFWPKFIARKLAKIYSSSEKNNQR